MTFELGATRSATPPHHGKRVSGSGTGTPLKQSRSRRAGPDATSESGLASGRPPARAETHRPRTQRAGGPSCG
jgi:hypothetical protein